MHPPLFSWLAACACLLSSVAASAQDAPAPETTPAPAAAPVAPPAATPDNQPPANALPTGARAEPPTVPPAPPPTPPETPKTVRATPATPKAPDAPAAQAEEAKGPVLELADGSARIAPFATLVGGLHVDNPFRATDGSIDEDRATRLTTVALTRFGAMASIGDIVSIESEMELNAGPHGTSVWEGQAALQVRNQLVRLTFDDVLFDDSLSIEVGRITDPTSLNYVAAHTANMLLSDEIGRTPLLFSGFNRGNGVQVRYGLFDTVTLGLNVNAGNPTSTTGAVMIGGGLAPFERFYQVSQSHVGRDARGFPQDAQHVMMVSPSVQATFGVVDLQATYQAFTADTNTGKPDDDAIEGFNVRGGVRARLFDNAFVPFVNGSTVINTLLDPQDLAKRDEGLYQGMVVTSGFDWNIAGLSGVGFSYSGIREQQRGEEETWTHIFDAGASYWLTDSTSVGARFAWVHQCGPDGQGETNCEGPNNERSVYLTLRTALGPASGSRP